MTVKAWLLMERCHGCECDELRAIFTIEETARAAAVRMNEAADLDELQRLRRDYGPGNVHVRPGVGLYVGKTFIVAEAAGRGRWEIEMGGQFWVEEWLTNKIGRVVDYVDGGPTFEPDETTDEAKP